MTLQQHVEFLDWVNKIEAEKNWSDNQFTKAAGLSHTVLSKARSGILPRWDACTALADAAGVPREQVFRAAGLMKPEPKLSPLKEMLLHWTDQLNDEDAEEIAAMIEARVRRRAEQARNADRKKGKK